MYKFSKMRLSKINTHPSLYSFSYYVYIVGTYTLFISNFTYVSLYENVLETPNCRHRFPNWSVGTNIIYYTLRNGFFVNLNTNNCMILQS